MKSKIKYIIIILVLLILLVPFRVYRLKDGGSVEFKAFLWSVTKVHELTGEEASVNAGWRINILGKTVYERTSPLYIKGEDPTFTVDGIDNPESVTIDIRADACELYLEVLEDLWNVDPGLNDGISQIGIDLSELSHLTELEKETVMHEFASKHNLPYITGTWEELCEQGYIDKDNLYWKDGLFFSIKTNEEATWNLPFMKDRDSEPELTAFDAYKWRSGLGAYFFGQCTAQKNADGKWTYTVGQEAIS